MDILEVDLDEINLNDDNDFDDPYTIKNFGLA